MTPRKFLCWEPKEENIVIRARWGCYNKDDHFQSKIVILLNFEVLAWKCTKLYTMVDLTINLEYIATGQIAKEVM